MLTPIHTPQTCATIASSRLKDGLGFSSPNKPNDAEASRLICVAFFFFHALAQVMALLRPVYGLAVREAFLGLPRIVRLGLLTRTASPAPLAGGAVDSSIAPNEVTHD